MIMIRGIIYVQYQRWVMKLSLKEKHLVIFFYVIREKIVLCKEDRETFFDRSH